MTAMEAVTRARSCPYCESYKFDLSYQTYLGGRIQESACNRCQTVLRRHALSKQDEAKTSVRMEAGGDPTTL